MSLDDKVTQSHNHKMSCFGGRMQEYDRISLDRFDGKNLQSTVYFLSHLHEDHTVGLAETNKLFLKRLRSNKDIFLYCSEVTQVLLVASKKYGHLKPYIKGLSINTPTTLVIPDPLYEEKEKITVTLLPAFHCPGSVMFLIEGKEGTVLYTGDFRWEHFNIEQMHHLRSGESVKKIKSMYVDTTFCTPENLYIPSRQQCMEAVCQLVQEWTSKGPDHVVKIYLRAQYGHEPLLNEVASRLKKKVHVNAHKVSVYNRLQQCHGNFTTDGINTQLHACDKDCMVDVDGEQVLCRELHDADKVLVILPTTMYFTQFQHLTLDKIVKKINDNFFRACYSFHSSYTEVKDLLSYLKPERVYPNVKPPTDSALAMTQHRLNTMLKECQESGAGEVIEPEEVKELGSLKTRSGKQMKKRKSRESTSDADSLDFGTPVKSARYALSNVNEGEEPPSPAESSSVVTRKGRGRGRGRGKGKAETASQPAVGTRRSTRRSAASSSQETTPKKLKKSERSPTPDLFLTPASDISDQHSSFLGSERSDSELSLFSSQKSIDFAASGEAASSWTGGSFLAAVSSSSEDNTGCVCLLDDEEQTDKQFEDRSQFTDTEEDESSVISPDNVTEDDPSTSTTDEVRTKRITQKPTKGEKEGKDVTRIDQDPNESVCTETHSRQGGGDCLTNDQKGDLKSEKDLKSARDESKTNKDKTDDSEVSNNELIPLSDSVDQEMDSQKLDAINTNIKKSPETRKEVNSSEETVGFEPCIEYDKLVDISDEKAKDDTVGKCLATPIKIDEKSLSEKDKELPEKTEGFNKGSDDNNVELSEDLHLHLSESTHGSEEDKDNIYSNDSKNDDEIVIIDSDSNDEVDSGKQDDKTLSAIVFNKDDNDRNLKEDHCAETANLKESISTDAENISTEVIKDNVDFNKGKSNSIASEMQEKENSESVSDIVIELSCSDEQDEEIQKNLKGTKERPNKDVEILEELKSKRLDAVDGNFSNSDEDFRKSEEKKETNQYVGEEDRNAYLASESRNVTEVGTDAKEDVQILGVESTKPEEGIKEIPDITDSPTDEMGESDKARLDNEDDDDVIEIVDLTGDDMACQLKSGENLKQGKKAIKISLLTKAEPVRKVKRVVEDEPDVNSESDIDEINEISSSPEWLSAKKASGQKSKYHALLPKKTKQVKMPKSKRKNNEIRTDKSTSSDSDDENAGKLSKKELDERAEVKRQAIGFMCETDSESDTDESSDPDSPAADILYDDYVELTSDSDNEDGIGSKYKGGKALGRKSKNTGTDKHGNGSVNGNSGSTSQGWLSSKKRASQRDSVVPETDLNKDINLETEKENEILEQSGSSFQQGYSSNVIQEHSVNFQSSSKDANQPLTEDVPVHDQGTCSLTGGKSSASKGNIEKEIDQIKLVVNEVQSNSNDRSQNVETSLTEKPDIKKQQEPSIHNDFDGNEPIAHNSKERKSDSISVETSAAETDDTCLSQSGYSDKDLQIETGNEMTEKNTEKYVEQMIQPKASTHSDKDSSGENILSVEKIVFESDSKAMVQQSSNCPDQLLNTIDQNKVTEQRTEIAVSNSKVEGETNEGKVLEPTKLAENETNDNKELKNVNMLPSDKNRSQIGDFPVSKKHTENVILGKTSNESNQDTSGKKIDIDSTDSPHCVSKDDREETKVLESEQDEKKGNEGETKVQNSNKCNVERNPKDEESRDWQNTTKSTSMPDAPKEDTKNNEGTASKRKKVVDWRKLPPAKISKNSKSSNLKNNQDQPAPPGTEDENKSPVTKRVPLESGNNYTDVSRISNLFNSNNQPAPPGTEEPPSLIHESKTKKISSVISTRRPSKTVQLKNNAPVTPPATTATHRPLYDLLVAGGAPTPFPPPGIAPPYMPQQYPASAPPASYPSYPPPSWGQYPYGPPPGAPFPPPGAHFPSAQATYSPGGASYPQSVPPPNAFTQPPPLVSNSAIVSTQAASQPTTIVSTASSLFSPPVLATETSTAESSFSTLHSSNYSFVTGTQSSASKLSSNNNTESTRTVTMGSTVKPKKLAPWQQKKANMFERGPSCIAKKDIQPKTSETDAWTPPDRQFTQNQENYAGQFTKLSQQGFQPKSESMDLATIKANISALTGISVANTASTSSPATAKLDAAMSKGEDLPALMDQLKKLQEMQAILEVVNAPQEKYKRNSTETVDVPVETIQYNHTHHSVYDNPETSDYYDRRDIHRDRVTREYQSEHELESYYYDERDRIGRRRSRDYVEKDLVHDRIAREYEAGGRRDRHSSRDYERRDWDPLPFREDLRRRDRDYEDFERKEREFERRYREEEDYRRWIEERRREDLYRDDRRHPEYDHRQYEDPHYDRRPPRRRSPEFEDFLERRRTEFHGRGSDSYESYDDQPTQRPLPPYERRRSHQEYGEQQTRFQDQQPEHRVNWNASINNEEIDYGTNLRANPGATSQSLNVQRPTHIGPPSIYHPTVFQKKPIVARVLSRSGHVLSMQQGWQSAQQTATTTASDVKEETTDVPVFQTGINYHSTPTDTETS